jgi:hypothetical protein
MLNNDNHFSAQGARSTAVLRINDSQFRPLHRAMQDAESVTESEDLRLKGRTAAKPTKRDAKNAENTGAGENRRRKDNSQFIKQIKICGNHNTPSRHPSILRVAFFLLELSSAPLSAAFALPQGNQNRQFRLP